MMHHIKMKHLRETLNTFKPFYKSYRSFSLEKCCYLPVVSSDVDGIVRSPLKPLPVPNLTIDDFLLSKCDRWAEKTAIVCADTGRSYSFEEYRHLRERVAQAFCAKLGLRKGDVIATFLPNIPEYMSIFLAAFHAGIIITSINSVYTADEVAKQMLDCSAKALITLTVNYGIASNAVRQIHSNKPIPIITIKHEKSDVTPDGAINFQELCDYNGPQVRLEKPDPEDVALLPYSSGTSGLPKGVQLKHRNVVANLTQLHHEAIKINIDTTSSHQDVIPVFTPLYHCYGMIPILFNLFLEGCQSVLIPKYHPDTFLDTLHKYPANIIHFVPPVVLMMINNENAKKHHLKRLRNAISAAAPLAHTDILRFHEKFGDNFKLFQYYGLTETGPVSHAQRLDRDIVPGSVGCTLSHTQSKIVSVDDDTKTLGPNESGHLMMRGPCIMPGYHNNPKATAESIDTDGWFKSGDIAHYDDNGMFFITDRIKELIKVKGFQVAPAELEALIRDHPDIEDAAVTSVPHEKNGEAPKAFIVPKKSTNLKPEHVEDYVKLKAAKHKHLTGGVVFVDSIPKNPSGKILRRLLKDL